jgi:hypothetical protein
MENSVTVPHEAPSDGRKSSDPLRMITNLHWRDFIDSSWSVSISFLRLIFFYSFYFGFDDA